MRFANTKFRRFLTGMLFIFTALPLFAQNGEVSGRVIDAGGQPLVGVNVFLQNTIKGASTDVDGRYRITNVPPGNYTVVAQYVGYKTQSVSVTVSADGVATADFQLASDLLDLDQVVVTATRFTRTQKESPLSLTLLNEAKIRELSVNSQADILREVPGVHAEGGGGEVAVNTFVRGLPAGGQYKYTPIQINGMPVEGTFGLTSSAQDVYFRQDLGFESMEFVRGGAATLFGVGSVAGVINYRSKKGGSVPENTVQAEWATKDRYKIDFNSNGPVTDNVFYSVSGFYRFDEGPIHTGLPTQGYQLTGNISLNNERGNFTIYGQLINDRVQFYLPFPIEGGTRERAKGNDGETVYTTQTAQAADISYRTPDGVYQTPIEDGVATRGGSLMAEYNQDFGEGWFFSGKARYATYDHQFNLFLTGSGAPGVDVETQNSYLNRVLNGEGLSTADIQSSRFTFKESGVSLPANFLLFENRILDRSRPFFDISADFNLSKVFTSGSSQHQVTIGAFLTRTEANDFNVITTYLGEFNDQPRLVDLEVTLNDGSTMFFTQNGVTNPGAGYTNNRARSSKIAGYIGDEIKLNRWRLDLGFRYELNVGDIIKEGNSTVVINPDPSLSANLQQVRWGNGHFNRRRIKPNDWGAAVGATYAISNILNIYGNFSKGYFFPELRSNIDFRRDRKGNFIQPDPDTEKIFQGEGGLKLGGKRISGTAAVYWVQINDRLETDFINDPDNPGNVIQATRAVGKTQTIGTEWTAAISLARGLVLDGNITLQDHEVKESPATPELEGKWIRRQPKFMAGAGLGYRGPKIDARIYGKHIGKRFSNNSNTIELDPNTIINLDAGYTFPLAGSQTLRLGVHLYNLFNDDGIDEADPRQGDQQIEGTFLVARPILPFRLIARATLNF